MSRSTTGNGGTVFAFYDPPGNTVERNKQMKEIWSQNVKITKMGRKIIKANMERLSLPVGTGQGYNDPTV